jgi:hypothetical protein
MHAPHKWLGRAADMHQPASCAEVCTCASKSEHACTEAVVPPHTLTQAPCLHPLQNEYAALFVALIGEGPNPQGVVNTSEGKVVRAFHRFTLVDQMGQGRDLTKGRTREAGAVKISCARQVGLLD